MANQHNTLGYTKSIPDIDTLVPLWNGLEVPRVGMDSMGFTLIPQVQPDYQISGESPHDILASSSSSDESSEQPKTPEDCANQGSTTGQLSSTGDTTPSQPYPQPTEKANRDLDAIYGALNLEKINFSFPASHSQDWRAQAAFPEKSDGADVSGHNGFVPMNQGVPLGINPTVYQHLRQKQIEATGMSPFYRGNPWIVANHSANIADDLNTSLWVTNLPPECSHKQLLGAIRDCGKVFATVINPPVPLYPAGPGAKGSGNNTAGVPHMNAAAKLVFFDRAGVERLLEQSRTGRFAISGYVPRLRANRIRSAPRAPGPQCRVLHIEGPSVIVNEAFLGTFFRRKFTYELEAVLTLGVHGAYTRQEWRFGSFRCQAESARQAIARERECSNMPESLRALWAQVVVHFGVDPCA
ncbi:hypothetical protein AAE478_010100 [Parahypoxylon ruwenzoriense]